jgi:hypothetical protein
MKLPLKIALVVVVLATYPVYLLVAPLFVDDVVDEEIKTEQGAVTLVSGKFHDIDDRHKGRGNATIVKNLDGSHVLQLTDFNVTNGPDLEVWLSAIEDPKSSEEVKKQAYLPLGQLKGNIGDQVYTIPGDADSRSFQSVVIWCETFGVLFSAAPLR